MRFLLFVVLLFGLDLVAFQPLQLAISDFSQPIIIGITILYWMVPISLILWLWRNQSKRAKTNSAGNYRLTRSIFYLLYLSKILLLFFVALFQVGGLILSGVDYLIPYFSFPNDNGKFIAQIGVFFSVFLLFLMVYGILRNRHRYKIHRIDVPIADLPEKLVGLKIIQISDIHSGSFTDKAPIKKGIDLINQEKPDIVFFTGDLVNSKATEIEPYIDIFDKIESKYGVFSIFGNHDYGDYVRWPNRSMKGANLERLKNTQKRMGWQLLLNENRLLTINGEEVAIIGVENYSASPRFSKYGDLAKAYAGCQRAALKLLLSHDPSHWEAQVLNAFQDIAVTFSGHTHGAQFGIEIPKLIKWSPVKYFYKQWAGLYKEGTQYLYVNRGFGYLGYPGRVGILPEITVLLLKKEKTLF